MSKACFELSKILFRTPAFAIKALEVLLTETTLQITFMNCKASNICYGRRISFTDSMRALVKLICLKQIQKTFTKNLEIIEKSHKKLQVEFKCHWR